MSADTTPAAVPGDGLGRLHWTAIKAVCRRQLGSLLGNPLGYIFILVFVVLTAAWLFYFQGDALQRRNITDLALLAPVMPWFLVVLLPALAMGAWASERESGTEELLLTLPMTVGDAVLGKYLAVVSFFTVALLCTLSNVAVLAWLGDPDWGLVFANYLGWWVAGVAFAAVALFASVLVSMPVIAFVLGCLCCAGLMGLAAWADWFQTFNRAVVSLSAVASALGVAVAFLSLATFRLASRRWGPRAGDKVVLLAASLALGLVVLLNVGRIGYRFGLDKDTSSEGLSSLSPTAKTLVSELKDEVTVTAFISRSPELPPEFQLKALEVADKVRALGRTNARVKVDVRYPTDPLDKDGEMAQQEFGIRPTRQQVDAATGKRVTEAFLGAAISSGGRVQTIEYFTAGLSVEYELVRAVRAVTNAKKRVVGIATTDLAINGSMDMMSGRPEEPWQIVEELKKQYEVRSVNLDTVVPAEVEVLMVPQPSSLTQAQLENLHSYVWNGGPTLMFEDPLPLFACAANKTEVVPGQPKKSNNRFGGPDDNAPQKGDLKPLLKSLGVTLDEETIMWSDYNPSHEFRQMIPGTFMITNRDKGGLGLKLDGKTESDVTVGISSLLVPLPGFITENKDKFPQLVVTPLARAVTGSPWGKAKVSDYLQPDYQAMSMGGPGVVRLSPDLSVRNKTAAVDPNIPPFAVEITGTMPSAWALSTSGTSATPVGQPSPKPVRVILVADTDLMHDQLFMFYRAEDRRLGDDQYAFLRDLRNVQFVANAIDTLFADRAYLAMRNAKPVLRPLAARDAVLNASLAQSERLKESIEATVKANIEAAQLRVAEIKARIEARDDIDEVAKAQLLAKAVTQEERQITNEINHLSEKANKDKRQIDIRQDRGMKAFWSMVVAAALAAPALILGLVAIAMAINRSASERTSIPTSRKRSMA